METQMQLRDPEIFPSEMVLKSALGEPVYSVLASFFETITGKEYGMEIEWRYYNDGKAWLGKVVQKKKTILWLSIWDRLFKTSFYFTEKHMEAIAALDISEQKKKKFAGMKSIGKLIPMTFEISEKEQLEELLTVVRFKKSLK